MTREELKRRLWSSDTFVDFDLSLNKTVNRLREALGDSADQPRHIETLPKRGYRFIGAVEWNGRQTQESIAVPTVSPSAGQKTGKSHPFKLLLGIVVTLSAVLIIALGIREQRQGASFSRMQATHD